jgi:hypothetical protein
VVARIEYALTKMNIGDLLDEHLLDINEEWVELNGDIFRFEKIQFQQEQLQEAHRNYKYL